MNDDSKRAILARRARFFAAAIATAGISAQGGCSKQPEPQVCLSPVLVEQPPDAGEATDESDAAIPSPERADAASEAAAEKQAPPRICLSEF